MKSFNEWFKENEQKFNYPRLAYKSAKMAWMQQQENLNTVQKSKQDEVDRLQKRINEALYCLRRDAELYGMTAEVEIAMKYLDGTID